MRAFASIGRFIDRVNGIFVFLTAVLIILMMLFTNLELVMRNFFRSPILGAIELNEYALLFVTFLGAAWVLHKGKHVRMDLVLDRMDKRSRAVTNLVNAILMIVLWAVITFFGAKVTWEHYQTNYLLSTALKPPSYLVMFIIPLGSLFLFVESVRLAYRHAREVKTAKRGL